LGDRIGELPCLISSGVRGKIVTGKKTKNIRMPAFADLSIQQMNSLISYLQLNWGKDGETVSEQKISQWLRSCP
jgi:mono/diheme cytochrome c family protein